MGKSYHHIKAMQQPDTHACWSTTMSWWTKAIPSVPDVDEVTIMGTYQHLTGSNGGLKFPEGFKQMLEDPKWGMKTDSNSSWLLYPQILKEKLKKGPIVCGYWEYEVGGFHAVALYNYSDKDKTIWAMDPNGALHINRDVSHFVGPGFGKGGICGYRAK